MGIFQKFDAAMGKLLDVLFYVCAYLLMALLALCFINVGSRLVGAPLTWADEALRFMMIWMAFLACPVVVDRRSHLVVDLVASIFPKSWQNTMYTIGEILALCFLAYIIFPSMTFVSKNFISVSSAMRIPMAYVYMCIPIGLGFSMLAQLRLLGKRFLLKQAADTAGAGAIA